jgi:uncharacterized membrane protein (UPF0127 family)
LSVLWVARRSLVAFIAAVFATLAAAKMPPAAAEGGLQTFERDHLVIETAAGVRQQFAVELALTAAQQRQGLMFRRQLPPDAGMLFVYEPAREVGMWMENTWLPLDMLFIAEDGTIVKVVERTVPLSRRIIASGRAVAGVLELNAGTAARLGIEPGARVSHEVFGLAR